MEEPSGTGSRGSSRDWTSAGAAVFRPAATAAPYQPHRRCISRFLDARSMARRASRSPEWVELRPGRDDRFPRTPPRTIRTPVGAPLLVGGGVTGSNLRAPRRRPVSSDLGFAHSGGGPRPRRNGGDVHRGRPLNRRRARPPVLNSSCASDPGRSSPIDSEAASRDCLACLVPPECAAPEHGGNKPCRRWKQRPHRRRSSMA
jgi:hypothetical protein